MNLSSEIAARTVISTRFFPAPREDLFAAYADPEKLVRWWGPAGFTMETESIDLRPGGDWFFVFTGPDGKTYKNHIQFVAIDAPERFVVRHISGPLYDGTVTFATEGGGTRITMYWTFDNPNVFSKIRDIVAEGNEGNFDRLWAVVSAG